VHPDLKNVIELQQVDLKVAELTKQIDSVPAQIQSLQSRLDEFIHAQEERKKRLAANQHERKDLDGDIKVIQEKIARHKDQLYQVKTNDQFRAMTKEIEAEEAKVRAIEDGILEKMLEAEEIQQHIQEAAALLEGEQARVAAEIAQLESERKADDDERARLQALRDQIQDGLSESTRILYQRIRQSRRGLAVAEVHAGFCTACNVLLRPQAYNDVRTNEVVLTCENCGRIIYYVEPVPAQTGESNGQGAEATA
jgi:predicted  nucleic acid-binding Zn-ribbon protein